MGFAVSVVRQQAPDETSLAVWHLVGSFAPADSATVWWTIWGNGVERRQPLVTGVAMAFINPLATRWGGQWRPCRRALGIYIARGATCGFYSLSLVVAPQIHTHPSRKRRPLYPSSAGNAIAQPFPIYDFPVRIRTPIYYYTPQHHFFYTLLDQRCITFHSLYSLSLHIYLCMLNIFDPPFI